jgi:hypothetical protein
MTREHICRPVPVSEIGKIRLGLGLPEALPVIGFGGVMVQVGRPLGTLNLVTFSIPKDK